MSCGEKMNSSDVWWFKRTVNSVLETDKYSIANIDNPYSKIFGGSYITKLNLTNVYLQITEKESQTWTTIKSEKSLFVHTKLWSSIVSSPWFFTCAMGQLYEEIRKTVLYLDSILISDISVNEYIYSFCLVLER